MLSTSMRNSGGLLWYMNLNPHITGEFSITVVQANLRLEDQSQVFTLLSATYVEVYDGHDGPEASRFVNCHAFSYLRRRERAATAGELMKIVMVEKDTLWEHKVSCLKTFEAKRFDKMNAVSETMSQLIEAWKEIPDFRGEVSPPPVSQASSKASEDFIENLSIIV